MAQLQFQERLPESSVSLKVFAYCTRIGHDELLGFVGSLRDVWLRIPVADRSVIANYWAEQQSEYEPQIAVYEPWQGGDANLASTEQKGLVIKFDWPTVRLMPSEMICNPLAHELAHVFQWATGKNRFRLTDDDLTRSIPGIEYTLVGVSGRVELHADEVITRWGFDRLTSLVWIKQHLEFKNGNAVKLTQPLTAKYSRRQAALERKRVYHSKCFGPDQDLTFTEPSVGSMSESPGK